VRSLRIGLAAVLALTFTSLWAGVAGAAPRPSRPDVDRGVVFVQTDGLSSNHVVAYDRNPDGTLAAAHSYATGGQGGQLQGSVVDHLASQGALSFDPTSRSLYAVNAGSNTVTVFGVRGDHLSRRQVIASGGTFPVSVAEHGALVYVLNALDGGSVQGYVNAFGRLIPIPGSARALGLDPTATPQFTHTPGQVAFSPDGRQLVVTTKGNGSAIDVFRVNRFGTLSAAPTVNVEAGAVPFAVAFDRFGRLVVTEAGTNAVATFDRHSDGTVTPIDSVPTGQSATCWVTLIGNQAYASNAGSASISRVGPTPSGLALLGTTSTDGGSVDSAAAPSGRTLYVQTGASGIVDEFHVAADGSLTEIGSVTVPDAVGGEGIVAL
jgi:6-phosphogluconolactonase (cycloisomerase 2 family)